MKSMHLGNSHIHLTFDEKGMWQRFSVGGKNIIAGNRSAFVIAVDEKEYQVEEDFMLVETKKREDALFFTYEGKGLLVTLEYLLDGIRVIRRARVKSLEDTDHVFRYGTFLVPALRIRGVNEDRFNSPGQGSCFELTSSNINFPPGIPVSYLSQFETKEDMYSTTPDKGVGVLTLSSSEEALTLAVWCYSKSENFFPMTEVKGEGVDFIHRNMTVFYMKDQREMELGTQYLEISADYPTFMERFQQYLSSLMGITPRDTIPQWIRDGAILELHVNQVGDFKRAVGELDRLKALGIGTLYLMPFLQYDAKSKGPWDPYFRLGSPYAITDYFVIDPRNGDAESFRDFVSEVHKREMKVLFDLVPQGVAVSGDIWKKHPEWFCRDKEGNLVSSHGWNDTYSLDWAREDVQDFFIGVAKYYVENFDIDGFRVDAPHWKEPNMDPNLPYPCSYTCFGGVRLIDRLYKEVKAIKPQVFVLCELWGSIYQGMTDGQCDYNLNWMIYNVALGRYTARDMQDWLGAFQKTYLPKSIKVAFLETHDTTLLTPPALPLRGALILEVLFDALMFMGHTPMIWYPELERRASYYSHLLSFRRSQEYLKDCEARVDKVWCQHKDVFIASRNEEKPLLFLANLFRSTVSLRLTMEPGYFSLQEGVLYRLVNLYTEIPLVFYRQDGSFVEEYTDFLGEDFSDLLFELEPSTTYWLELTRV